jgi:hypothetical protein
MLTVLEAKVIEILLEGKNNTSTAHQLGQAVA